MSRIDTTTYAVTAYYAGEVIAKTNGALSVEGNFYLPIADLPADMLSATTRPYVCPWKGKATYYDVHFDGKTLSNAAWGYRTPLPAAAEIADMIAFDDPMSGITVKAN
jgi:uncharacterized protein (DUF427 family)